LSIRDNKLSRLARERRARDKAKGLVFETEMSVDDQLTHLEDDIRRLKIEFDIYFNGGSKRPPYDTKNRVEAHIKRLGDDRTLSFAQRYRYNSLATRHASFRDMWRRIMQGREEGRDPAAVARATAKIEAVAEFERRTFACADVHQDVGTIRNLYDSLIDAKQRCGESTQDLSFPRFHRLIAEKTNVLKERLGSNRVLFSVDVENGHVSFKATSDRD
jgi:hypothetical protein